MNPRIEPVFRPWDKGLRCYGWPHLSLSISVTLTDFLIIENEIDILVEELNSHLFHI